MPVPVTKNLDVLDIRDFGGCDDAVFDPNVNAWTTGTDNTPALIKAVDAAKEGQPVFVPAGRWLFSPVPVFEKMVPVWGAGRFSSRLIAHPDSPAGESLFTLQRETPNPPAATSEGVRSNHQHGMAMRDLFLDGNGRLPDIEGIRYRLVQQSDMMNVEVRHFARQGINCAESVRESGWYNVTVRSCGDRDRDMPGWDIRHEGNVDGHNNLWLVSCEMAKNLGVQLAVGSRDGARPVRSIHMVNSLIHGSTSGVEGATNNWYGYTDPRLQGTLVSLEGVRGMHFSHVRLHESAGEPMIRLIDPSGSGRNSLSMSDCEFGSIGNPAPIIRNEVADRIQLSNTTVTDATATTVVDNIADSELLFSGTNEFSGVPSHQSPSGDRSLAYWDDRIEAVNGFVTESPDGNRWLITVDNAGAVQVAPA